jgi:hypothetical protein
MTNYKLAITIILMAVGLAVFTFVVVLQIIRLKDTQWTFWDVIIVAAILFIMIWIIPDIRNVILRWRERNQK